MITINRLRMGARKTWYLAQARLLIAQVNRRMAQRKRLPAPGYDELRCPWFLGVMFAATVVLAIDVTDHWFVVIAFMAAVASGG